jgi:hypothetical protein
MKNVNIPIPHWVTALIAIVATGFAITFGIQDNGDGGKTIVISVGTRTVPTQTKVDSSPAPGTQPIAVTAPAGVQAQVAANTEDQLHGEVPPGVTPKQASDSQIKQDQLAHNDQLPIVQPDAAPTQRGCVSRFVRNYSSRRGVAPREFTLHYTVSHNVPGWNDVDAVVNLFNTSSSQASSNYVVDAEGHCAYIVRESDKAWTQAGGNPYSVSVEIIAYGNEKTFCTGPCRRKVGLIISDSARRWHFPLSRGSVSGCLPLKPGIIQHKDWGLCGGGHFDVTPFSVGPFIIASRAARCSEGCQVRREHALAHKSIRDHRCASESRTRSTNCRTYYARNHAMHARARQLHVSL